MALEKCNECGLSVSTSAKMCPHCGATPPEVKSLNFNLVIGVALIFIIVIGLINQKSENLTEQKRTTVSKQKYIDDFIKNPENVLTELNEAIKNKEWVKATNLAEYYLPSGNQDIKKIYKITSEERAKVEGNEKIKRNELENDSAKQIKNTNQYGSNTGYITFQTPACISDDLLTEFIRYLSAGDNDGTNQLLQTEQCTVFQKGQVVSVIRQGFSSSVVRYKGVKLYVLAEALTKAPH